MQPLTTIFLLSLLSFTVSQNAQAADGPIVPFTSVLPACASNCGPLYDVQGACAPPNLPAVNDNCFCTDTRLTPFDTEGTAGVTQVCGAGTGFCTAQADLQTIKTWYDDFCATSKAATTTGAGGATSTSTSTSKPKSGGGGNTWLSTHYKWVIMLVVVVFFIVGGWIVACLLRRRYIRKKEKEIEMRPPVAWGPHQLQGMTGGYNYGDGIVDANRGGRSNAGGHNKEAAAVVATPANARKSKRESKGWLTKDRK